MEQNVIRKVTFLHEFGKTKRKFQESYCRLHISGDLGELIAMNYRNMCWNQFDDFVNDIDYFQEKILCHSRPFFVYDQEQSEEDIKNI